MRMNLTFLRKGDRLHVRGLPGIDFSEIFRRTREYRQKPDLLILSLPYEIVIGIYEERSNRQ